MGAVIEMHDSECIDIKVDETGGGSVLLDAYVHRSDGDGNPLSVPHEGGIQRLRLTFEGISIDGTLGELPAYIYEGSLLIGTEIQDNILQFPAVYTESVRLSMMLSDDARTVVVAAGGLSIAIESDFRFVEMVDFSS